MCVKNSLMPNLRLAAPEADNFRKQYLGNVLPNATSASSTSAGA